MSQPSYDEKKETACVTMICLVIRRPYCVSAVLILCLSICFAILFHLFDPYRCLCCSISYINLKSSNFKLSILQHSLLHYQQKVTLNLHGNSSRGFGK